MGGELTVPYVLSGEFKEENVIVETRFQRRLLENFTNFKIDNTFYRL